ncbi:Hypothetical predicted protein [Xyrichtys novacula]|uniref:Uncharacterized protein n=1 Tax=Xyrichtys novacula TaxID=13765 RepID=A0AAV1GSP6_XYRNO|nr:Hypothetical predicted protein [Xyrichtys novacula]
MTLFSLCSPCSESSRACRRQAVFIFVGQSSVYIPPQRNTSPSTNTQRNLLNVTEERPESLIQITAESDENV